MLAVPRTIYACHSLAHASFPCKKSNCPGSCRWYLSRHTFAPFLGICATSHHIRRLCSQSHASFRLWRTALTVYHVPSDRTSTEASQLTCSSPMRRSRTGSQRPGRHPAPHHVGCTKGHWVQSCNSCHYPHCSANARAIPK